MKTNKTRHERSRRCSKRRLTAAAAAVALVATGAVGAQGFADEEGGGEVFPPGQPFDGEPVGAGESGDQVLGSSEFIVTNSTSFDPTIVTKYIAASSFQTRQGDGLLADTMNIDANTCFTPSAGSGGANTELYAPVELPDGARIKRISFYGHDAHAVEDISVSLYRTEFATTLSVFPFPSAVTRATTLVDGFTTSGQQTNATSVFGLDDLEELTGSPSGSFLGPFLNRFHTARVILQNAAGGDHVLCGVRVEYQVAALSDPGSVFHALDPVRAYDSRQPGVPENGRLGPNESKVIDITDGYTGDGTPIPAQQNSVPANATAIAYNITVAGAVGSNFVAVTAGDAASFTASAINYSDGVNVANGSTVTIASDQTIKLWGGDRAGSSHIIIDVVGYYTESTPPNMAN